MSDVESAERCGVMMNGEWVLSEVGSSEMVIRAESVSYLEPIELMQLGSNARIMHVGLFGMIQLCLELIMSQFSNRSTLYTLRPFLGGEPCLTI